MCTSYMRIIMTRHTSSLRDNWLFSGLFIENDDDGAMVSLPCDGCIVVVSVVLPFANTIVTSTGRDCEVTERGCTARPCTTRMMIKSCAIPYVPIKASA